MVHSEWKLFICFQYISLVSKSIWSRKGRRRRCISKYKCITGLREVTRVIVILLRREELSLLNNPNTRGGTLPVYLSSSTYRQDNVGNTAMLHAASYETTHQDLDLDLQVLFWRKKQST